MGKKKKIADRIWTVVLTILALLYVYPIIMILFNSAEKRDDHHYGRCIYLADGGWVCRT